MRKFILVLMLVLMCLIQTVFADSIAISLNNTLFAPNEEIIVNVSGITEQMVNDEAYVSIYKEGAAHDEYMSWHRPIVGTSKLKFVAPTKIGSYEMRLYKIDHVYSDESFVIGVPFHVALSKQGKISMEKNAYLAEQIIPVTVIGITQEMEKADAYVSIFKKGAAHDEYGTFKYVRAGNSVVELEAPNLNGEFEMRLYSIDHNYTDESFVMSVPFTLSGATDYNASDWAKTEIKKADEMGLIPNSLKSADLTKPITREEFAELAVKLYEKIKEITAVAVSPNPFTDTNNPEILKAYKIGVTQGTSDTTFEPKVLINREQCAAMLYRVLKAVAPQGNFSIEGVKDFPDQKHISDWAVEAVKYMNKIGIIAGDSKGNFMPKATTSTQQAESYGMATREQAIAMSYRSYERYKDRDEVIKGDTPQQESPKTEEPKVEEPKKEVPETAKGIVGTWTRSLASGSIALGQSLEFKSDGTFERVVGTIINYTYNASAFEGDYKITGDKLILTNQMMSSGYAESWEELWKISNSVIKDIPVDDQEYTIEIISDEILLIDGNEFERTE